MSSDPSAPDSDNEGAPEKDGDREIAPGDVVEIAHKPYRVVDIEGGVLRVYDLVERSETLKSAGARDVEFHVDRSQVQTIFHRVREERERRDIDEDRDLVTDGGRLLCVRCNETYDRDEHDQCPNCTNFDIASFGGVER
jgi:hypothetical protein